MRMHADANFITPDLTLEDNWRSIILFGRNVASYKFALGKSLLEFGKRESDFISLEDLAIPFSRHLCEHLNNQDKQCTSKSSKFLGTCREFNNREITHEQLIGATEKMGFVNVIDAFHVVLFHSSSSPCSKIRNSVTAFITTAVYHFIQYIREAILHFACTCKCFLLGTCL